MKPLRFGKYIILMLLAFVTLIKAEGQFYNGMQMSFGKNRVQYTDKTWKYYRFDRFDVYSYKEGTELSLYVADFVEKELPLIERFFDYDLEQRMIFVVYNKMSEFKQSNIGLSSAEDSYNIGGKTKIIQNKVAIYFEGDHVKFKQQIRAAIAEVVINELMFGNSLVSNVANTTTISLPDWYVKGLISFVSNPWDYTIENRVKDGIVSGKYDKLVRLSDDDAVYAGHSLWKYVADLYGESIIPNILYLSKVNKSAELGFLYVLGQKLKEISIDWSAYYLGMYMSGDSERELPERTYEIKKSKKGLTYQQVRISPNGTQLAYVTNQSGRYKIWIYNSVSGKHKKIYKKGESLEQEIDYSYPVIDWHPSNEILGFITEEKGRLFIHYYNIKKEELTTRRLLRFDKILDMEFSPDRRKIVFSAINKGQTDIYLYDIAAATREQITNDIADDFNPRFINNMNEISFASNRRNDTIFSPGADPVNNTTTAFSIYVYNLKTRSDVLRRISEGNYINHIQPLYKGDEHFVYLSDKNGIYNQYMAEYDSTISFIDTTIHYRYFANSYPLTNSSRNILKHDYNKKTKDIANIIYHDGRYHLYKYPTDLEGTYGETLENTEYRNRHVDRLQREDSLHNIRQRVVSMQEIIDNELIIDEDTIVLPEFRIDINKYVFEKEKLIYFNQQLRDRHIQLVMDSVEKKPNIYFDYRTSFYPDELVNQIDFSFLNESYQTFTGGEFYYNPNFNMLIKVGANDLFEDYRIVGGVRLPTDMNSSEYLLSFENLKNRLDEQVIFHRQTFNYDTDEYSTRIKSYTHEVLGSLKFPINQAMAVKGTATFRHDNMVYLSTDIKNLAEDNILKVWGGLKLEYIYDNSRKLGTNLFSGTRLKVFGEAYKQINLSESDLYVLGADLRHYIKIHRTLIWANRFATSTSFGRSPLIYYMGGVDNWSNFMPGRVETFNKSVDIDYAKNYSFQAIATNLRGFNQNIRNGNNFAVLNTELRWPVFRYFANHPLSSSFLNDFQIVGFADVGSAWTGLHPFTKLNAWNTETIPNNPVPGTPVVVTIDSNRDPIVAGYGFGLRSQLFGYFIRVDWAWGIENLQIQPRIFYLSLSLDF
jgi:hypothetical protein